MVLFATQLEGETDSRYLGAQFQSASDFNAASDWISKAAVANENTSNVSAFSLAAGQTSFKARIENLLKHGHPDKAATMIINALREAGGPEDLREVLELALETEDYLKRHYPYEQNLLRGFQSDLADSLASYIPARSAHTYDNAGSTLRAIKDAEADLQVYEHLVALAGVSNPENTMVAEVISDDYIDGLVKDVERLVAESGNAVDDEPSLVAEHPFPTLSDSPVIAVVSRDVEAKPETAAPILFAPAPKFSFF